MVQLRVLWSAEKPLLMPSNITCHHVWTCQPHWWLHSMIEVDSARQGVVVPPIHSSSVHLLRATAPQAFNSPVFYSRNTRRHVPAPSICGIHPNHNGLDRLVQMPCEGRPMSVLLPSL